jgi:hypothetical protein
MTLARLAGDEPANPANVVDILAAPPGTRGWPALQAWIVDRIKRRALRHLHTTALGERLLLSMYLDAEEASLDILRSQLQLDGDDRMTRQITQHLEEEGEHTALYAAALDVRGPRPSAHRVPAGLSRRKLARWDQLARKHTPSFVHGSLVLSYATVLCAEQMAVRILQRHCETIGARHALYPLFSQVLEDERRHVRLCAHTLHRLVAPAEMPHLIRVLAKVRKIETGFAISGAIALYAAGLALRIVPGTGPR